MTRTAYRLSWPHRLIVFTPLPTFRLQLLHVARPALAMNGFDEKGLDEDAFGEKSGLSGVKAFDAFRESNANPPASPFN